MPGAASSGVPGTNDVMSVIAKVENDALTRDRYLLTMWLYEFSVSVTVSARDETAYPLAEAMRRLRLRVPEAMGRLDGDAMIELVLPLDLMDEQVDRWRVPGRPYPRASRRDQLVRSHALLGYSHPVVVRDLDRFSTRKAEILLACAGTCSAAKLKVSVLSGWTARGSVISTNYPSCFRRRSTPPSPFRDRPAGALACPSSRQPCRPGSRWPSGAGRRALITTRRTGVLVRGEIPGRYRARYRRDKT